jgi:hypothetical protein
VLAFLIAYLCTLLRQNRGDGRPWVRHDPRHGQRHRDLAPAVPGRGRAAEPLPHDAGRPGGDSGQGGGRVPGSAGGAGAAGRGEGGYTIFTCRLKVPKRAPATTELKRTAPLGPFYCPGQANPAVMCLLLLDTTSAPVSHGRRRPVACRARCSIRGHRRHWRTGRVGLGAVAEAKLERVIAAWAESTRPKHGLSQSYVNRINGCLDCRPHLRPSVRMPAALHGHPVSDSPGMG